MTAGRKVDIRYIGIISGSENEYIAWVMEHRVEGEFYRRIADFKDLQGVKFKLILCVGTWNTGKVAANNKRLKKYADQATGQPTGKSDN